MLTSQEIWQSQLLWSEAFLNDKEPASVLVPLDTIGTVTEAIFINIQKRLRDKKLACSAHANTTNNQHFK